MALSFNKKTADQILKEHSLDTLEMVYAYGTKAGFTLLVPKQVFIVFKDNEFTVFNLSAFHKVKDVEKIAWTDISNFKFSKGLTGGQMTFKVAGKKVRYEFLKNLVTLKDQQRDFLLKLETLAK